MLLILHQNACLLHSLVILSCSMWFPYKSHILPEIFQIGSQQFCWTYRDNVAKSGRLLSPVPHSLDKQNQSCNDAKNAQYDKIKSSSLNANYMQIDQVLLNTLLFRFLLFDFVTAILFIIEMEMWFIEFCIVLKWLAVMVSGQITYSGRYSFKCGLMTSQLTCMGRFCYSIISIWNIVQIMSILVWLSFNFSK